MFMGLTGLIVSNGLVHERVILQGFKRYLLLSLQSVFGSIPCISLLHKFVLRVWVDCSFTGFKP